jgi:hypothetical protein
MADISTQVPTDSLKQAVLKPPEERTETDLQEMVAFIEQVKFFEPFRGSELLRTIIAEIMPVRY